MKSLLKKLIPKNLLLLYHKCWAILANYRYGFPSNKLIVIGVTGTNGKSTTSNLIARVLEETGAKVGLMTTVNFKIADKEWINDTHKTMQGRLTLQKMLKQMVKAGCKYAVIETSSEGIMQNRNWGINYDMAVFTNLTPEHIEAHGSFENYKKAKGLLFSGLGKYPKKIIGGQEILKTLAVNLDDQHWQYYFSFPADKKYGYGISFISKLPDAQLVLAGDLNLQVKGSFFRVGTEDIKTKLIGRFNVYNCLAAICVGLQFGLNLNQCKQALAKVTGVPGRMETIDEGQDFSVLVDYAHDPVSFDNLFKTIKMFPKNRVIHVFGSAGGVRDHAKRPLLGRISGEQVDISIITDEDSYDEPTSKILNEIAAGAISAGKIEGQNLFKITDRREGIKYACQIAQPGDLVLITGKGTEQSIKSNGQEYPWDDRNVTREILRTFNKAS
ncbi:MAG: UDP-N-acetylmuramoyl-L-alanyl-D-glutamate--2,6-diaminopimelate ligase [Candidatus Parcubacteria bacterium]|nr:UDP-N-acetylmuramoyl-L-alanyl-D-glutamate--2,6-diaminopimelate ligase [Candidatus Parcubacteria bacterium]